MPETLLSYAVLNQLMLDQVSDHDLEQIFEHSNDFSNLTNERQNSIRWLFAELKVGAAISHKMNAFGNRSVLDQQLRALNTSVTALADRLAKLSDDPLQVPLLCVASDLLETSLISKPQQTSTFQAFDDIIASLRPPLAQLQNFVDHLRSLIAEFDQLDILEQGQWFRTAKSDHQRNARLGLYPYLRKSSPRTDAAIMRCIEVVFESVYASPFDVYPRNSTVIQKERGARLLKMSTSHVSNLKLSADSKKHASKSIDKEVQLYCGPGLEFACRVIQTLELGGLFIALTKASAAKNYRPSTHSRQSIELSKLDFDYINRYQAFGRTVAPDALKNKIGRLWATEKQRRRKAKQSETLLSSANSVKSRRPRKKQLRPRNGNV